MIVYRELSSLVADLGYSANALYSLSNHTAKHYQTRYLPKRDGGKRELHVPDAFLKAVQRKIADVLLPLEPISEYAAAYRPGGSTKRNAAPHVGQPVLLKLDIWHFFDCIRYAAVKDAAFPAERYSEQNRILLALLCTEGDVLPQGAPTSPAISNLVLREFDETLGCWCENNHITYTRYCDDMTFSGDFDPAPVIAFVREELKKRGFVLNDKKITVVRTGRRKTVTGVVVNEKTSAPAAIKKELRQTLYYCEKFGIESHMKRKGIEGDSCGFAASLLGRVNYVLYLEPDNTEMQAYRTFLLSVVKKKT